MIIVPKLSISRDHPSKWESEFYPAPDGVDVEAFQKRLNQIAGVSHTGEPILRLEWGGTAFEMVHIEWNALGMPTRTERRPKYKFLRPNPITQVAEEIPIRRWIISERSEPEQYRAHDDSDMYFEEMGVKKKRQEKPQHGWYAPLVIIGDHRSCPPDCSDNKLCFGDYKEPSEDELDWVREATYFVQTQKDRIDPRKPIDKGWAEETARKETRKAKRKAALDLHKHMEDHAKDFLRTHGHRFTQDTVSDGKWGKLGKYDVKPKNIKKDS